MTSDSHRGEMTLRTIKHKLEMGREEEKLQNKLLLEISSGETPALRQMGSRNFRSQMARSSIKQATDLLLFSSSLRPSTL